MKKKKKKKKKQRACSQQKTSNGRVGSFLIVLVAKRYDHDMAVADERIVIRTKSLLGRQWG
jgi:hypothetical protein